MKAISLDTAYSLLITNMTYQTTEKPVDSGSRESPILLFYELLL